MAAPSIRMSPLVGSTKRGSRLTSEVLPAPDGPTKATVSPARIDRLMSDNAATCVPSGTSEESRAT
jgi:hypothetical protein